MRHVALKRICQLVTDPGVNQQRPFVALEYIAGGTGSLAEGVELPQRGAAAGIVAVSPGDVLFGKLRPYLAKTFRVSEPMFASTELLALRPSPDVDSRWLHYLAMSDRMIGWAIATSDGSKMPRTSWAALGEYKITVPELPFQRAIADFLDAETARIDALIDKKRRMLKSFSWRRIALARDLLRGAKVHGPRKPSGVPWLGDIPVAWTTPAVGHRFEVQLGRMLNQERAQGNHPAPYLRNLNVGWDRLYLDDVALMDFPPSERARYLLRAGDLLVCEGGAGVAEAAIWNGEIGECYYQKSLHRVRSRGAWPVEWLVEWLRLWKAVGAHNAEGNLATIPHLTAEQFRAHRVPMPEPAACRKLLRDLRVQDRTMNRAAAAITRQLKLLGEHRQALITAAVTGQIEVPGAVAS